MAAINRLTAAIALPNPSDSRIPASSVRELRAHKCQLSYSAAHKQVEYAHGPIFLTTLVLTWWSASESSANLNTVFGASSTCAFKRRPPHRIPDAPTIVDSRHEPALKQRCAQLVCPSHRRHCPTVIASESVRQASESTSGICDSTQIALHPMTDNCPPSHIFGNSGVCSGAPIPSVGQAWISDSKYIGFKALQDVVAPDPGGRIRSWDACLP
jgi:hypothetical protein